MESRWKFLDPWNLKKMNTQHNIYGVQWRLSQLFLVFWNRLSISWLSWNPLCSCEFSPGWPQNPKYPPATASWMLDLKACLPNPEKGKFVTVWTYIKTNWEISSSKAKYVQESLRKTRTNDTPKIINAKRLSS